MPANTPNITGIGHTNDSFDNRKKYHRCNRHHQCADKYRLYRFNNSCRQPVLTFLSGTKVQQGANNRATNQACQDSAHFLILRVTELYGHNIFAPPSAARIFQLFTMGL